MAGTFKFEVVSPERVVLAVDAEDVQIPGMDGDFTVLAGHAPVISSLRPGVVTVKAAGGKTARLYVPGGFVEVDPKSVTLLAERALDVEATDGATFATMLKAAEESLAAAKTDAARFVAHGAVTSLGALAGGRA
jgi:F-type H+-transporting ATPase subunit epsilon